MTRPEMKARFPVRVDPGWIFCVDGYDPLLENSVEVALRDQQRFPGYKRSPIDKPG